MTTFLLLVTFLLEMVWMLWGEIHPWSLLGVKGLILNFESTNSWKVIEEKRHLQFFHMYLVRQHNEQVWHQLHPSHLQRTVLFPSIQKNRKFRKLKKLLRIIHVAAIFLIVKSESIGTKKRGVPVPWTVKIYSFKSNNLCKF